MGGGVKKFCVVRPYASHIRTLVFAALRDLGFDIEHPHVVPPGTPDDEAIEDLAGVGCDLLLLPFHVHEDRHGARVDGLGVAALLPAGFPARQVPILMPVSTFSFSGGFQRRLAELERIRPEIADLIIPLPQADISTEAVRARLAG